MTEAVTIVDDNAGLRYLLALLLKHELGLPCISLASLADVQAHAEHVLESQVAILDVNLGAGQPDGVAVHAWLRSRNYQGRIFFLTGHAKEYPQMQQARETGARILEKPMTPEEMIRLLTDSLLVPGRPVP